LRLIGKFLFIIFSPLPETIGWFRVQWLSHWGIGKKGKDEIVRFQLIIKADALVIIIIY
jgi:hypothetical protein